MYILTIKHPWIQYTWGFIYLCSCSIFWQDAKRPSACPRPLGSYWSVSAPRPCRSLAFWAPAPETPAPASLRRSPPRCPSQDPPPTSTPCTPHFLQPRLQRLSVRQVFLNTCWPFCAFACEGGGAKLPFIFWLKEEFLNNFCVICQGFFFFFFLSLVVFWSMHWESKYTVFKY